MAYISSFTYCDSIQPEMTPQGIKPQIIRPLQMLTPVALPSNYSFAIAFSIIDFDITKENNIRILFISPTNKIINDTNNIKFKIPEKNILPNQPNIMQFNLEMRNVIFREKGMYSTQIFVNEEKIGEYKIAVVAGE